MRHSFYLKDDKNSQVPKSKLPNLDQIIWSDKKRPFFGMPLSFTRYTLYPDRLIIESGLLTYKQEELRLYRILDVNMTQSLSQRLFGVGSIRISSSDTSTPNIKLCHILQPKVILRKLSDAAETERQRYRIGVVESLGNW